MSEESANPVRSRRRWFQWRLRTLLIGVTLVTVVLAGWTTYIERYRRERKAIEWLEQHGAGVITEPEGPAWVQRILGEERCRFVDHVYFGDRRRKGFGRVDLDELLTVLQQRPRLKYLSLECLPVTDQRLGEFASLPGLKSLYVERTQVTLAASEELADARPDLILDTDPSGRVRGMAWALWREPFRDVYEIIYYLRVAAAWKLACAGHKNRADAEASALAAWAEDVERLWKEASQPGREAYADEPPWHRNLARCELAWVRIRLVLRPN